MTPRYGGRPNRDRVMVSFYLARSGKAFIADLAKERQQTQADTLRAMLAYAQLKMPRGWNPPASQNNTKGDEA